MGGWPSEGGMRLLRVPPVESQLPLQAETWLTGGRHLPSLPQHPQPHHHHHQRCPHQI